MHIRSILLICFIIALIIGTILYSKPKKPQAEFGASVVDALSSSNDDGEFARATKIHRFTFPEDAGPHPEFQTEWWYYTGNLSDKNGRHFGFQLTFFRRALSADTDERRSDWATNQVYFAHFAVSDVEKGAFYPGERWSRGAAGLAGAETRPFRVWLEDWSADSEGDAVRLRAGDNSVAIDLRLTPAKPVALHGENGISRKSEEPGNASYYYSQTRLRTEGSVVIKDKSYRVRGLSWLDREWSTSSLSREQSGWDWFALQLSDGREIMLYRLRLKNGGISPYSSGSFIERDGTVRRLNIDDFSIETLDTWKSPQTGVVYPSGWRIGIPKYQTALIVTPYQPNQELPITFTYWEGAVRVEGKNISGSGYVELTGYAESGEEKSPGG